MYKHIQEKLGDRSRRKIENNTCLETRGNGESPPIALLFHSTDVVTYHNDKVVLQTGGWQTYTTKERINWGFDLGDIPLSLYQEKRIWYLWNRITNNTTMFPSNGICEVTYRGRIVDPVKEGEENNIKREWEKTLRRIRSYVKAFGDAAKQGDVPEPNGGDCWFCYMVVLDKGEAWGDSIGEVEHILNHIKERYFVPSMLINAIRSRGYGNPDFVMQLQLVDHKGGWNPAQRWEWVAEDLRKYLQKILWPYIHKGGKID